MPNLAAALACELVFEVPARELFPFVSQSSVKLLEMNVESLHARLQTEKRSLERDQKLESLERLSVRLSV